MEHNPGLENNRVNENARTVRISRFGRSRSAIGPRDAINYPSPPRHTPLTRSVSPANLLHIHEFDRRQKDEIDREISKEIRKTNLNIMALVFVAKALLIAAMVIRMIIIMLFIIALFTISAEKSLLGTLSECRFRDYAYCYSKIMSVFFPLHKIVQTSRLLIRISSSGLSNSPTIFELGLPLSAHNPFILLTAFFFVTVFIKIVASFYKFLEKTAEVITAIETNKISRRSQTIDQGQLN